MIVSQFPTTKTRGNWSIYQQAPSAVRNSHKIVRTASVNRQSMYNVSQLKWYTVNDTRHMYVQLPEIEFTRSPINTRKTPTSSTYPAVNCHTHCYWSHEHTTHGLWRESTENKEVCATFGWVPMLTPWASGHWVMRPLFGHTRPAVKANRETLQESQVNLTCTSKYQHLAR